MDTTLLMNVLGWCSLLHAVMLLLSTVFLRWAWPWVGGWYARQFAVDEQRLRTAALQVLMIYKTLVWTFFAVPYLVLLGLRVTG